MQVTAVEPVYDCGDLEDGGGEEEAGEAGEGGGGGCAGAGAGAGAVGGGMFPTTSVGRCRLTLSTRFETAWRYALESKV